MLRNFNKVLGGVLLVSGTTIGAGMLALPISTGLAGFYPAVALFVVYWLYMAFTAFLMLEANFWMKEGANIISMAKQTLGRWGEVLSWVTYLFLLYALTTAYIAGSGPIFLDVIHVTTGWTLPSWAGALPLLGIFGYFVYRGTRSVDLVNRLLMFGLVVAYFILAIFLTPYVDHALLQHVDAKYLMVAVSVVATSFGFHIIIPTLTSYLNRDLSQLKKVIFIGSVIPLVVYIVWEALSLGIIPLKGANGIITAYAEGSNGAFLLTKMLGHSWLATVLRCFSFFAIVTSFLGVSLSLSDFLADGLKIKKTSWGRGVLAFLTFTPPLAFTLTNPRAFLSALEYAGAFGVVILLGLLPALMVWWGRYRRRFESTFRTPGGKPALLLCMAMSFTVMFLELANKMGWLEQLLQHFS